MISSIKRRIISGLLNAGLEYDILRRLPNGVFLNKVNLSSNQNIDGAIHNSNEIGVHPSKQGFNPILHRTLNFEYKYSKNREIWIENLDTVKEEKRGLIELNSCIFGVMPRLDIIFANVKWQTLYRKVVLESAKTRAEMRGGGRKPHPQKGLGKARQGSIRAPHIKGGGVCHGPRNPTSYFHMIDYTKRLHGMTSTLSAKFAQDDIHVVDDIMIPTDESQYLLDLIEERKWGPSVLIVDNNDIFPRNITLAADEIGHVTLMPLYGLNVHGMLKHETLVLTLGALNELESKLTTLLNSANPIADRKLFNG